MSENQRTLPSRPPTPKDIAILLLSLGEKGAAQVFKHLSQREVRQISTTMATISPLKRDQVQEVLDLFFHTYRYDSALSGSSKGYLSKTLKLALGDKEAKGVMDSIFGGESNSLEAMKWMDSGTITELIVDEHPQLQAVVLTYLGATQATDVLMRLPAKNHQDLLSRVARLQELHPSIIEELNIIFDANVGKMSTSQNTTVSGLRQVADIMNRMNDTSVQNLLSYFKEQDKKLAEQIEQQMFLFEHLMRLDEDALRKVMAEVSQDILALALKGAAQEMVDSVVGTMTKRSAKFLLEDIENLGPVRASQVQSARNDVLRAARQLAASGEIELSFNDEDEMIG
ncbi:flagellar motor switch protein FliG [Endozoicomonas sp. 8E]|uniref:flagellar motor switch protein FliG n=1 Tax=Endozoicomonas sp. 8E TaxID=3035692 RepID=UPI00293937F5|nr:flagellar motor switch protein FliG [Endozoicomonas sp. 8E]WOG29083.1 flagellar motor switch protein FliG [Endozoicomonas sp. 8E]